MKARKYNNNNIKDTLILLNIVVKTHFNNEKINLPNVPAPGTIIAAKKQIDACADIIAALIKYV